MKIRYLLLAIILFQSVCSLKVRASDAESSVSQYKKVKSADQLLKDLTVKRIRQARRHNSLARADGHRNSPLYDKISVLAYHVLSSVFYGMLSLFRARSFKDIPLEFKHLVIMGVLTFCSYPRTLMHEFESNALVFFVALFFESLAILNISYSLPYIAGWLLFLSYIFSIADTSTWDEDLWEISLVSKEEGFSMHAVKRVLFMFVLVPAVIYASLDKYYSDNKFFDPTEFGIGFIIKLLLSFCEHMDGN
jgi:hypothetical protein